MEFKKNLKLTLLFSSAYFLLAIVICFISPFLIGAEENTGTTQRPSSSPADITHKNATDKAGIIEKAQVQNTEDKKEKMVQRRAPPR